VYEFRAASRISELLFPTKIGVCKTRGSASVRIMLRKNMTTFAAENWERKYYFLITHF
jgi:hypothetical protein